MTLVRAAAPFASVATAVAASSADTAPERSIVLTGASNFRDLGGYAGLDGRLLKWRHLFRADHLAALSAADLKVLAQLGITRTADFRGQSERTAQAYALPGVATHVLGIEPTVIHRALALQRSGHALDAAQAVGLMQDTYRGFVSDSAPRFAELFGLLLESDAPIVFHCTAGKDRTGFAAALILLALGVPRAVVMQDYLLTNQLYRPPVGPGGAAPDEVLQVLWRVQEDFLETALHGVEVEYGGIQPYLERVLGLNAAAQKQLAALYLQP